MRSEHKFEMKSRARNIALLVSYDGTNYEGFQRQSNGRAVQNVLERKLQKIFGDTIELAASGRTDSGVHARGQVVNFFTDGRIPIEKIPVAVNSILPPDIVIRSAVEADREFSARHSVVSKIYSYSIYQKPVADPFLNRYALHVKYELDFELMHTALKVLEGTHDFSTFRSATNVEMSPVRNMVSAEMKKCMDSVFKFELHATGFLYHMARNIIGTILKVGRHEISIEQFREKFNARDHSIAPWIAPANGLCLEKVFYDRELF